MIPTILKGCTSQQIALALPADFDPAGRTLTVAFNGVTRSYGELAAGGTVNLSFSAEETSGFPLGTARVFFVLSDTTGNVTALPFAKIKVTDSQDEYAASIGSSTLPVEIKDALIGVSALPSRWNESDIRSKINEIIARLGGAVAALLLAFSASGASITLQTAPKGEIYNDEQIVTNATFDASGLATKGEVPGTISNIVTKTYVEDLGIAGGGAEVGDYANVSNRAMNAVQKGEDLEMISDGEEYGYKLGPGGGYPWDGSGWSNYESFFFPLDYINSGGSWNWYQIFSDQDDPDKYAATLVRQADLHIAKNEVYDNIDSRGYLTNETDPSIPAWAKSANPPTETDPTIPAWAKAATKPTYTASEVGAATPNDVEETRQIVATWENFLDGSNVVFSITNYLSGTYGLDAAKMTIKELRDGEYREVYNSRDEILLHIDDFSNKYVRVAISAIVDEVAERLASKADKDWGKYTSAGGEAPANTVYMTAPNTVFAGGLEYERVAVGEGMICVLTTHGAPVWMQGDEGTFKFQDDGGTNYFGFAKTDSYTIGANTDGIAVENGLVTLTYNIAMSGRPCVWYKADLKSNAPWEQLNLPDGSPVAGATHAVTWEQNPPAETQMCYINVGNAPQGFFRATVEVTGEAKFMTNMPADLSGGVICTNTTLNVNGVIKPTFNGSSVIWNWSVK